MLPAVLEEHGLSLLEIQENVKGRVAVNIILTIISLKYGYFYFRNEVVMRIG